MKGEGDKALLTMIVGNELIVGMVPALVTESGVTAVSTAFDGGFTLGFIMAHPSLVSRQLVLPFQVQAILPGRRQGPDHSIRWAN
jgi:hypothetical protein